MPIDPIDQTGHPSPTTDRPWMRGDRMIVFKGTDNKLTCWLTRETKDGNWYVSGTPDLKAEVTWYHPSSLTLADPCAGCADPCANRCAGCADPEPKAKVKMTDLPWMRGDKVIVTEGDWAGQTCWLMRPRSMLAEYGWLVCLKADLAKEDGWLPESSLAMVRLEVSRPALPDAHPVNDPNNLDHIDLATQHMGYSLGRAVECLWEADQGDQAMSLQELRKAQRNIQIEITRREWKEANR